MIHSLSGSRSPYQVFSDWVECCALSIQNSCHIIRNEVWKKREEQYARSISPYGKEGKRFGEMLAMMVQAMEEEITDTLGEIYMEAGIANKNTGQFFTPFSVSYALARISLRDETGEKPVTMHEPAAGAGGMIIAAARVLHDRGINYQRCLKVTAQELDWKGVYMCYTQLSLLGIDAEVAQGDTLREPYTGKGYPPERVFYTPRRMGVLI